MNKIYYFLANSKQDENYVQSPGIMMSLLRKHPGKRPVFEFTMVN